LHWDPSRDALSFAYSGISSEEDVPTPWHLALLRAFNEVEPDMLDLTILPDEAGILYRSASKSVLWAFQDVSPPTANVESMRDVLSGEVVTIGPFVAKTHRVYALYSKSTEVITAS
jgi:hypothetical protein